MTSEKSSDICAPVLCSGIVYGSYLKCVMITPLKTNIFTTAVKKRTDDMCSWGEDRSHS